VLPENQSLVTFVYLEKIAFLSMEINRISEEITGLKQLCKFLSYAPIFKPFATL
jgi:hypothetical protein